VRRPSIPSVLRELVGDLTADPLAFRILIASSAALFAAGLNPHVFAPGLATVQAAVRARPEAETMLMVALIVSAGLLFIGGVLADTVGKRSILTGALAVLAVTALSGLIIASGPIFVAGRLVGAAAASLVLPFALAAIATTFRGVPRATALGVAYAAYGGAMALAPVLITLLGPDASRWPAFLAAAAAAVLAYWIVRPRAKDLPGATPAQRPYIIGTAVWAFAVVLIVVGVVGFGAGFDDPRRYALIAAGVVLLGGFVLWERRRLRRPGPAAPHVERRPIAVAVMVGVVIGFAQAAPLLQLPIFFQVILGYGPNLAAIATVPFMAALVIAGPVAGILISRYGPRTLVAGGVAAVGLGNLLAAAFLGPRAAYVGLIAPFVFIGAGFVIATTVRTAIIFASVPRGLPGTAAALNEASLAVGSRIGLVVVTVAISRIALDSFGASLQILDPAHVDAAVADFNDILIAIGTPAFGQLVTGLGPADASAYADAYTYAVRLTLAGTGLITLVAAVIAWFAIGRRDPLATVWEHQDERTSAKPVGPGEDRSEAAPGVSTA
jgi:MFS family permease